MSRFFIIIFVSVLLFCSCSHEPEPIPEDTGMLGGSLRDTVLYYATDDGYIIPVMRQIPWEEGIAACALSYLVATDENSHEALMRGVQTVIPEGTGFELKIDGDGNAKLDVQNMPMLPNAEAEQIFLQSVVNTLTEFESIETVSMTFDGETRESLHHGTAVDEEMRAFMPNPVMTDMETMANTDMYTVSFYIPDSRCVYNLPMTGYSSEGSNFSQAMEMFCEQSAVQNNGLPAETRIISAEITDGVAVVNFSEEADAMASLGDGVLQSVYEAVYLTAAEYGEVNELKLYAGAKQLDCSSCSVSVPMYVNEWN